MLRGGWSLVFLLAGCSFAATAGTGGDGDGDGDGPDAAAATCAAVTDGIVAWWDGEDVGVDKLGTYTTNDDRGRPSTVEAMVNDGTQFDRDEIVILDTAPAPAMFTVEAWIRLDQGDAESWIGVYGRFAESSVCVYQNRLTFWEGDAFTQQDMGNLALGATTIPGAWHHVATTWDGTTLRNYVDGELDAEQAVSDPVALPDTNVTFGGLRNQQGLQDHYDGVIDELTIFDRALSAAEVAEIAAAGELGKCAP